MKTEKAAKGGTTVVIVGVVVHLLLHEIPLLILGMLALGGAHQ